MASAALVRVQTLDGKQSLIPDDALGVTDPADGLRKTIGAALIDRPPVRRAPVGDASYMAGVADTHVALTGLTATRTITLPPASIYLPGAPLVIADETGACSPTRQIVVAAWAGDTIAGAASQAMISPYAVLTFRSNGSNLWTFS